MSIRFEFVNKQSTTSVNCAPFFRNLSGYVVDFINVMMQYLGYP